VNSRSLLIVSLGANLLLAGWLAFLHGQTSRIVPLTPATGVEFTTNDIVADAIPVVETESPVPVLMPFQWTMLDSDDVRVYVANLRESGCPEYVLRDLLVMKLGQIYKPKLLYQASNLEPWAGSDRREAVNRAERQRMSVLRREMAGMMHELLGYEWNEELSQLWSREPTFWVALGFIPQDRARQVVALITTRVRELEDQGQFQRSRIVTDENVDQIKRFRAELSRELGKILTVAELDELETRAQLGLVFSDQIHLDGMNVTGPELRTIANASKTWWDFVTFVMTQRGRWDDKQLKNDSYGEFEAAVLARLGPVRFEAFQRAQDEDFRKTLQFTKRSDLADSAAVTLYNARRDAEAQQREISFDPNLTDDERKVAFEVLETVTSASVGTTLGRHYTNYLTREGEWVGRLSAPATVSPVDRRGDR
jgi:hypothetical protein